MQVFIALVQQKKKAPAKTCKSKEFRDLIEKYMEEHCQLSGYVPVELKYSQHIAAYECTKIDTVYRNANVLQFGSRFRMLTNQLTRQKDRIKKTGSKRENKNYKRKKKKIK